VKKKAEKGQSKLQKNARNRDGENYSRYTAEMYIYIMTKKKKGFLFRVQKKQRAFFSEAA
jgi:hypothetical protein